MKGKARQVAKTIHIKDWTGECTKRLRSIYYVRNLEVTMMMMMMRNLKKNGLDVMRGGVGDGITIV